VPDIGLIDQVALKALIDEVCGNVARCWRPLDGCTEFLDAAGFSGYLPDVSVNLIWVLPCHALKLAVGVPAGHGNPECSTYPAEECLPPRHAGQYERDRPDAKEADNHQVIHQVSDSLQPSDLPHELGHLRLLPGHSLKLALDARVDPGNPE